MRSGRIAKSSAVFLLAGAIVNVAVAWGCAFEKQIGGHTEFMAPMGEGRCSGWVYTGSGVKHACISYSHTAESMSLVRTNSPSWLQTFIEYPEWLLGSSQGAFEIHSFEASGWPLCALTNWTVIRKQDLALPPIIQRRAGIPWDKWPVQRTYVEVLPTIPIWPGFAINTMFYAGVLWLVFAFPVVVRRRRRIKRGLCPACAYPIGTSKVCTECGAALATEQPRRGDGM